MSNGMLQYPLAARGYIHNWLVAGPRAVRVEDLDQFTGDDYKLQIARHYYQAEHGLPSQPKEGETVEIDGYQGRWNYFRCRDDHFVDLTAFYHICHYLRGWAYTSVKMPKAREVSMVLTTNGPADVWINGQHVHRQEHFHHQIPFSVPFQAGLQQGQNEILVRMEEVAARECPYAMALQLSGLPQNESVIVQLPTTLDPDRRLIHEKVFESAYTRQDVYHNSEMVEVHWPEAIPLIPGTTVRMQSINKRIYAENTRLTKNENFAAMGEAVNFPDGEYRLVIMPRPQEYYEGNMRITREIPVRTIRKKYSTAPYGTYEERRIEALREASDRIGLNIFADIASMALDRWKRVETGGIVKAIDSINQRADCSDFYLCGLLGMKYRFESSPSFPDSLKQPLEDCILNFKYWNDEPCSDSMCYTTENHSILFHTCEVLAGQLYPDRVFSNNGQTGQWHREMGERRALEWLQKRAATGFHEWDSNCYFEEDVLALTHLADFAETQAVWEMAAVVLDKMFFTMALNSYKGVFGSTHGRTYTPFIKGGWFEATSGMSRLAWGMGVFNDRMMGTVSLACSEYEVPTMIASIAADLPDEMWNREHHVGTEQDYRNSGSRGTGVNKVTYKTPDYMLCSAQDWHPGEPGYQQHIWQATFGPDAVAFVTHPVCSSEEGSHRPNFWHGNKVLPRVAQWKDVLIALHNFPADDWMGFTHAYFPVYAYDEWSVRDGWAFGRKGDGFIAITAARGLELVTTGDNAYRELRSYGHQNVWLVQMGRAAQDGSFAAFQNAVLARSVSFGEVSVSYQSLRGQQIAFGWTDPLTLDGVEQPITGFKHYENPYCAVDLPAKEMEIWMADMMMRLKFEQEEA